MRELEYDKLAEHIYIHKTIVESLMTLSVICL